MPDRIIPAARTVVSTRVIRVVAYTQFLKTPLPVVSLHLADTAAAAIQSEPPTAHIHPTLLVSVFSLG